MRKMDTDRHRREKHRQEKQTQIGTEERNRLRQTLKRETDTKSHKREKQTQTDTWRRVERDWAGGGWGHRQT